MGAIAFLGLGALGLLALAAMTKGEKTPAYKKTVEYAAEIKKYATALLKYINKGGTSATTIKAGQVRIFAQQTGVADTQTRRQIEKILGRSVPWKPSPKVKPKVTARVTPVKRKVKVKRRRPLVKTTKESGPLEALLSTLAGKKTVTTPKAKTTIKPVASSRTAAVKRLPASTSTSRLPKFTSIPLATSELPDSVKAANALDAYLRNGGLARERVKEYQRRMGGLAKDGIPGPLTKARAEKLLSRKLSWPATTAAIELRAYYRKGGRNRTKIKAYQTTMGELTADGLVGPKTKRRYKQLTGKTF